MNNTHYKAVKLKNGELMACSSDTDLSMRIIKERSVVEVHNPVVFNSFKFLDSQGELVETISMMPMMPISDNAVVEISTDHIFSIAEMRSPAAERYQQFLQHLDEIKDQEDQDIVDEIEAAAEDVEETVSDNVVDISKFSTKILH